MTNTMVYLYLTTHKLYHVPQPIIIYPCQNALKCPRAEKWQKTAQHESTQDKNSMRLKIRIEPVDLHLLVPNQPLGAFSSTNSSVLRPLSPRQILLTSKISSPGSLFGVGESLRGLLST